MDAHQLVLCFLESINRHDANRLAELMGEDHVFTDSLGRSVQGRESMRAGWRDYFAFCPDYWVAHEQVLGDQQQVAVFGTAGGTIAVEGLAPAERAWRTPAAWLAVVERGLVQQWRVYADNKPVYDIVARAQKPAGPSSGGSSNEPG